MANLVIPNKAQHEYVVGIDFGHGETSAAICPLEWDTEAGQREAKFLDIDLDRAARRKVIVSAICRVPEGVLIGDEAFEHITDNNGIAICFKQKPTSIDGEAEKLMIDYMGAVYSRIREYQEELTDSNHIVYIARPSGWVEEETKELYRQMAIKAGIPLAGLTSESRAAIFYAKTIVNFSKEISQGAIVFDLGSSTLDFTFLSDDDKPVDYGYNLGASIIDNAILENMILADDNVKEFVQKYPEYRDALKFMARKFKEEAYGRNEDSKTIGGFPLGKVISEKEKSYDDYADTYVKLRISNLAELNEMVETATHYMSEIEAALKDFRDNKISGRTVNGVFLTGGASRMNFIRPLISRVFDIPVENVKIDADNPSLTISRGIALLGSSEAITSVLAIKLREEIPDFIDTEENYSKLVDLLSNNISNDVWEVVVDTCNDWVENGETNKNEEYKNFLDKHLKVYQESRLPVIVNDTLQCFIENTSEEIRKRMNEIISRYAPGREMSFTSSLNYDDTQQFGDDIFGVSSVIAKMSRSLTKKIVNSVLVALGFLFVSWLILPVYFIVQGTRSKESKRKNAADNILKRKEKTKSRMKEEIFKNLIENHELRKNLMLALTSYINELIETNIQKVIIPIE